MSSSTITVNPRKKTADQVAPPPVSVTHPTSQVKGTVLVRTPLPKYSFEQKLKKKTNTKKEKSSVEKTTDSGVKRTVETNPSNLKTDLSSTVSTESILPLQQPPPLEAFQTGSFVATFPQAYINPQALLQTKSDKGAVTIIQNADQSASNSAFLKDKPVNKVGPISKNSDHKLTHSVSDSMLGVQNVSRSSSGLQNIDSTNSIQENVAVDNSDASKKSESQMTLDNQTGFDGSDAEDDSERENTVTQSAVAGSRQCGSCSCAGKIKHLEEEKQLLKNQLDVQLQVNQELKKLLVASVGEDLQHRVERLTRDRALMSQEIGDYSKRITDGYENLDQISIQADMWRSKYLACRVMADEMASSKAFYQMQYQECQLGLEKMLNERHQLRANLYETYRGLEQVQEAFDPLHAQGAGRRILTSKNVLDLARTNQHLMESIKYRLLPSHVTSAINSNMEPDWHDYLTQAEAHAKELLSREMRPEDFRCLVQSRAPGMLAVDRYHPCANYDNLTINVCCKCKGEIRIV